MQIPINRIECLSLHTENRKLMVEIKKLKAERVLLVDAFLKAKRGLNLYRTCFDKDDAEQIIEDLL